jgi:hypothetical protein
VLLAATIQRRFPGASTTHEGDALAIEHDGMRARVQMTPAGRVAVELPCDGFELDVRWTDRTGVPARPSSFDDSFLVETNDIALAAVWLDHDARSALLASRYVSEAPPPERVNANLIRDDSVGAERTDAEPSPERVADVLAASLLLARRPVRWAHGWARIARELGGEASACVEIGGRPIVRTRRRGVEVAVRLLRRLARDERGRLRTLVTAHRHGSSGDTLTLIADDLPPDAWPPANEYAHAGSLRIDARATSLLDRARPSTTIVRPHDIEITFDGALGDRERLDAAVELAATWASTDERGPYR